MTPDMAEKCGVMHRDDIKLGFQWRISFTCYIIILISWKFNISFVFLQKHIPLNQNALVKISGEEGDTELELSKQRDREAALG